MSMKFIAEVAEARLNEMEKMEAQEALRMGVTEVMEILLETAGVYSSNCRNKTERLRGEDRKRIVKKVWSLAEKLMLEAMRTTNDYGVNRGRFIAHIYTECENWLEIHGMI